MSDVMQKLKELSGQTIVVKIGGSILGAAGSAAFQAAADGGEHAAVLAKDIALAVKAGIKVAIVHGGGPLINKALAQSGKVSTMVQGLRVTDADTLHVVQSVLSQVNSELVACLQAAFVPAVPMCTPGEVHLQCQHNAGVFLAKKKVVADESVDLGLVREVEQVNTELIKCALDAGFVPVLLPLGCDSSGIQYNLNADDASLALAAALKASKLINLTDVPGVLKEQGNENSLINSLNMNDVNSLIADNTITGGMIAKLRSCVAGLQAGIGCVHIASGQVHNALLKVLIEPQEFGTSLCR